MAASVAPRAACGASYNACASGATPCKFETRQPARPAGKGTADRQFQRRVRPHYACDATPTLGQETRIVPTRGLRCSLQALGWPRESRYFRREIELRGQERTPHAVLCRTGLVLRCLQQRRSALGRPKTRPGKVDDAELSFTRPEENTLTADDAHTAY